MASKIALSTAKRLLRSGAASAYYMAGGHKRANLGQFIILMYHRVLRDDDPLIPFIQPGMYVRESSFNLQLELLSDSYEIVSLKEMLELIEMRQVVKDRQYCVITFDDGWVDNYQQAFPILKRFAAPATIFLTTSYVGTNRAFWHERISRVFYLAHRRPGIAPMRFKSARHTTNDPLTLLKHHVLFAGDGAATIDNAVEALKPHPISQIEHAIDQLAEDLNISPDNERTMLNWQEVDEMGKNNVSFGSHTCEHQILTQVDVRKAASEIYGSMEALKNRNLNFVPVFCYPNGRYNDQIRSLVIEAGYSAAVSTCFGRESSELKDPFALTRIGIHDDISRTKPLFSLRIR